MLSGVTRRFRGGTPLAGGSADLLIGDEGLVVPCPSCGRPLARGQGRCPGCGTLLVAGVRLQAAGFLILVGCALGMIGGALVAGVAMAPRLAAGDAAIAVVDSGAGVSQPATVAASTAPGGAVPGGGSAPASVELPEGVAAGLLQVAAINDRLAAAAQVLAGAQADGRPRAAEVAMLIRRVAADARSGGDAARRLGGWAPAAALATDATAIYAGLVATATDALAAPLADQAAYLRASRAMLAALGGLPAVAATTRDVAGRAGVELIDSAGRP